MNVPQIKEWMLIIDKTPLSGALNMAVDDFLFQSLSCKPETFLRFYTWKRPTVSLGYAQNIRDVVDQDYCNVNRIDIVRRMTGGKLVLHHKEVTYCLCSSDVEMFTSTLMGSYRLISEALVKGLEKMGLRPCLAGAPPVSYVKGNLPCFSHPAQDEIELGGKKIVGSAQKRTGSKFIQHGSIPLEENEQLLRSITSLKDVRSRMHTTSLLRALGKKVSFDWAVEHLIAGISEYFGVRMKMKIFDEEEKDTISRIQKERYENRQWTFGVRPY